MLLIYLIFVFLTAVLRYALNEILRRKLFIFAFHIISSISIFSSENGGSCGERSVVIGSQPHKATNFAKTPLDT